MATTTIDVVPVRETSGTSSESYRAIKIVWKRELIRWSRNRTRIVTALMQPILFLFVLGTGLADLLPKGTGHVDFKTFIFPGVLAMIVLFVSIYSAISIVWDREFGFMREMMVAPVPRAAIVVGKCLGGATVATIQGAILLAMAGLVHVPYNPVLIISCLLELTLTAFTLTALGIMLAARMQQVESFQVIMQIFVLPLFFLSGAVFPLSGLPTWLEILTRVDPLTYAIDAIRRGIFAHINTGGASAFTKPLEWGHYVIPVPLELAIVLVVGLALMAGAIVQFSRPE